MLARTIDNKLDQIDLVENSGIQFTDYEIEVDWGSSEPRIKRAACGYFLSGGREEPYIRLRPDEGEELVYRDGQDREIEPADCIASLKTADSLKLYDGVWFPVPYFAANAGSVGLGPWTWARCRIADITERMERERREDEERRGVVHEKKELTPYEKLKAQRSSASGGRRFYHVVIAFDTRVDEKQAGPQYFLPLPRDVNAGTIFTLSADIAAQSAFLKPLADGAAWVNEWAASVFTKLAQERLPEFKRLRAQDAVERMREEHLHEQHYLNVLAFLNLLIKPKQVRLIANSRSSERTLRPVEVSLVLDIGNSRSCGILVESYEDAEIDKDDLSGTTKLVLRDLNAPENEYSEPFVSRVEFAEANFDFDGKSARSKCPSVFSWPSLARVGTEAVNLSSLRQGSEGRTGLTSPKRFLWQSQGRDYNAWFFNSASYQTKSDKLAEEARKSKNVKVFARPYCSCINSHGEALFARRDADNLHCLTSGFSYRSMMTFMLAEIFLQAVVQMNSAAHRHGKRSENQPRRLKTIILTVPPAMAQPERENLRSCVFEALGIIWKCLGYDPTPAYEFAFVSKADKMYPPVPEVKLDWNEAEAGQIVYLYNETQKVFKDCGSFIRSLKQDKLCDRFNHHLQDPDSGAKLTCARIASLDIGGGTTDLVIRDYTLPEDRPGHASDIKPFEVLSTGAKVAGDDLLLELIRKGPLAAIIKEVTKDGRCEKNVLERVLGGSRGEIQHEVLRLQFVEQVLSKAALRIMFHLENLKDSLEDVWVKGTIGDFLLGSESTDDLPSALPRPPEAAKPNPAAVEWFDNELNSRIAGFAVLQVPLEVNLSELDRQLREGAFNLCSTLGSLSVLINQYEPDVLLLTGRPSQLPAVRAFFEERLALSPERIVSMHSYECPGGWYPFSPDSVHVGDPKTTAAVGALLSHMRSDHTNFPNFHYQAAPVKEPLNQIHYVGIITQDGRIRRDDELFILYNNEEKAHLSEQAISSGVRKFFLDESGNSEDLMDEGTAPIILKLAADFGFRQFASPSCEAEPLYRLEMLESVAECRDLKAARALLTGRSTANMSDTEIEACLEEMARRVPEISDTFVPRFKELSAKAAALSEVLEHPAPPVLSAEQEAALKAQAEALHANDKVGFLGKLSGQRSKAAAQDLARLRAQLVAELTAKQQQEAQTEQERLKRQRQQLLTEANANYIDTIRRRLERRFKAAENACNSLRADFVLELNLSSVSKESEHPYPYLKRELKDKLPRFLNFEVKSLNYRDEQGEEGEADLAQFFKFKLRTVLNDDYWTLSGRII